MGFAPKPKTESADKAWLVSRSILFFAVVIVSYGACFISAALLGVMAWINLQTEWIGSLMAITAWWSFLAGRDRLIASLTPIMFSAEERLELKLDTKK